MIDIFGRGNDRTLSMLKLKQVDTDVGARVSPLPAKNKEK